MEDRQFRWDPTSAGAPKSNSRYSRPASLKPPQSAGRQIALTPDEQFRDLNLTYESGIRSSKNGNVAKSSYESAAVNDLMKMLDNTDTNELVPYSPSVKQSLASSPKMQHMTTFNPVFKTPTASRRPNQSPINSKSTATNSVSASKATPPTPPLSSFEPSVTSSTGRRPSRIGSRVDAQGNGSSSGDYSISKLTLSLGPHSPSDRRGSALRRPMPLAKSDSKLPPKASVTPTSVRVAREGRDLVNRRLTASDDWKTQTQQIPQMPEATKELLQRHAQNGDSSQVLHCTVLAKGNRSPRQRSPICVLCWRRSSGRPLGILTRTRTKPGKL